MKVTATLSIYLCTLIMSVGAFAADSAMTAGDLQQICIGSDAESKTACRFYILGVTQGIGLGMNFAEGKVQGRRPCVPDNISGAALELTIKMKLGQELMVFPDDRKLDATGVIGAILIDAFKCRKAN